MSYFPGYGDSQTWPSGIWHPNDPRRGLEPEDYGLEQCECCDEWYNPKVVTFYFVQLLQGYVCENCIEYYLEEE